MNKEITIREEASLMNRDGCYMTEGLLPRLHIVIRNTHGNMREYFHITLSIDKIKGEDGKLDTSHMTFAHDYIEDVELYDYNLERFHQNLPPLTRKDYDDEVKRMKVRLSA